MNKCTSMNAKIGLKNFDSIPTSLFPNSDRSRSGNTIFTRNIYEIADTRQILEYNLISEYKCASIFPLEYRGTSNGCKNKSFCMAELIPKLFEKGIFPFCNAFAIICHPKKGRGHQTIKTFIHFYLNLYLNLQHGRI